MTPEECALALTYANQVDPRIQLNDPTLDAWWTALQYMTPEEARWGIADYYGNSNPNDVRGVQPLQPATLRHRVGAERERVAARARALEPPRAARNPSSFRSRDPGRWDALIVQGRDDYRASLRARGIEPHSETCPDCVRDLTAAQRRKQQQTPEAVHMGGLHRERNTP